VIWRQVGGHSLVIPNLSLGVKVFTCENICFVVVVVVVDVGFVFF